jgi:hypothetical protein
MIKNELAGNRSRGQRMGSVDVTTTPLVRRRLQTPEELVLCSVEKEIYVLTDPKLTQNVVFSTLVTPEEWLPRYPLVELESGLGKKL